MDDIRLRDIAISSRSRERRIHRRKPERGNTLVLSTIVMSALGTLAVLTVVNVQGGMQSNSTDRFHQIAVYAAESGGAAGMEYLRANMDATTGWASLISASNTTI